MPKKKKTTKRKTKSVPNKNKSKRQSQQVVVYVDRPRARRRTQKRRGRGLPSKPHWRGGVPPEMSSSRTAVYYINEGKHSSRRNDLLIAQNRQRDLQQERGTEPVQANPPVQSFLNEIDKVIDNSNKLRQSIYPAPPSPPLWRPSAVRFDPATQQATNRYTAGAGVLHFDGGEVEILKVVQDVWVNKTDDCIVNTLLLLNRVLIYVLEVCILFVHTFYKSYKY